jgi:hypothetical protein
MTSVESALKLQRDTEQALVLAYERQVIGYAERHIAAVLVAHVRSGRGLTADEARQAWRLLARDPAKLTSAGIQLPGADQRTVGPEKEVGGVSVSRAVRLALREDGRIGVEHWPFELNDAMKLGLHGSFHRGSKTWSVPASPACAATLMGMLGGMEVQASVRVRELADQHSARVVAHSRLDPGLPIPDLDTSGLTLGSPWDHQVRGIEWAASATASLLGFKMGAGKSMTAIGAVNKLEAERGIILCPNKVRGVWPREVAKWSARSWHVVDGKRPPLRKNGLWQDLKMAERVEQTEQALFDCTCGAQAHFAVWNYEMLAHEPAASWRPPMMLDAVIYDEVHKVKSPTGAVSKSLAEWVNFTKNRIGLTGTPMPQYPWDIFGVYRALDPGIFGTVWTTFKNEYVFEKKTREGKSYPVSILGLKQPEFAEKVHSIMYRPQIDLKLPALTDVRRYVDLEPKARLEYNRLEKEFWADLSILSEFDNDSDDKITPKNILSRQIRLSQFTGGTVPDDELVTSGGKSGSQHRVSRVKEDQVVEFASKARSDGTHAVTGGLLEEMGCYPGHPGGVEPVVVYANFHNDLDVIRGIAKKAGLRYAEISGRRSDGLTRDSRMNPDCDLLAVQIQAGGTGVDLTRSCYGIWYSKGRSVGDYDQARARQHRPGQLRPVTFVHLACRDTIDEDKEQSILQRRSLVAVSMRRQGLDPAAFGVSEDRIPDADADEVAMLGGGGVVLPIDEFGGVMAPRVSVRHHGVAGDVVVDKSTLSDFRLEDF